MINMKTYRGEIYFYIYLYDRSVVESACVCTVFESMDTPSMFCEHTFAYFICEWRNNTHSNSG